MAHRGCHSGRARRQHQKVARRTRLRASGRHVTEQRQVEAPGAEKATIAASMALRVLAPFAAGYFLTYLLRAVNAVVAPDLVGELGLSAADLGLLTASYLGAFALFQLPLGVLLDRYGPRRVQAALVSVAAIGCALFAIGGDVFTLT